MCAAAVVLYCFKVLVVGRYRDLLQVCGLQIGLNYLMAFRHARSDDSDNSIALTENAANMSESHEHHLRRGKKEKLLMDARHANNNRNMSFLRRAVEGAF